MEQEVGRTKDVGFQIGVSRTLPYDAALVWELLTSPSELAVWLGKLTELPTAPGEPYATADGTTGEIRSFHSLDRVRLSWRPRDWDHDTVVQVAIQDKGHKTMVRFHQEWLADAAERARQRDHWQVVMAHLAEELTTGEQTH